MRVAETEHVTSRARASGTRRRSRTALQPAPIVATVPTAVLATVLATVLAGCGGAPSEASAPPPATTAAPPTTAAAPVRDEAFCAEFASIRNAVGQIDTAAGRGPVLPAAVALLLLAPRSAASAPGISDPELGAALDELVAAIDEVDAQGRERLPEGGNAATDAVPLDTARLVAAVESVEQACADL